MMLKQGEEEANRLSRYNRAIHIFSDLIKSDSVYQAALGSAYIGKFTLCLISLILVWDYHTPR